MDSKGETGVSLLEVFLGGQQSNVALPSTKTSIKRKRFARCFKGDGFLRTKRCVLETTSDYNIRVSMEFLVHWSIQLLGNWLWTEHGA